MQDKEEVKLEQIRASVQFPFHSFSGVGEQSKPVVEALVAAPEVPASDGPAETLPANSKLDDIIVLQDDNTDSEESGSGESGTTKEEVDKNSVASALKIDKEEPMSLSDLSSSFQQCFQSANKNTKAMQVDRSQESSGLQLKPFDYEAARKQVIFGDNTRHGTGGGNGGSSVCNSKGKKKSDKGQPPKDDELGEFSQGRRRKAFPATGNRSSTFR